MNEGQIFEKYYNQLDAQHWKKRRRVDHSSEDLGRLFIFMYISELCYFKQAGSDF